MVDQIDLEFEIDWDVDLSMYYLYKVENGREYYLKDIVDDQVIWTAQLCNAIQFGTEDEIELFRNTFLPNRVDLTPTRR